MPPPSLRQGRHDSLLIFQMTRFFKIRNLLLEALCSCSSKCCGDRQRSRVRLLFQSLVTRWLNCNMLLCARGNLLFAIACTQGTKGLGSIFSPIRLALAFLQLRNKKGQGCPERWFPPSRAGSPRSRDPALPTEHISWQLDIKL